METKLMSALGWIWDHCENITDYTQVLKQIGYTRDEAHDDLYLNCDMDETDAEAYVHDVYDVRK